MILYRNDFGACDPLQLHSSALKLFSFNPHWHRQLSHSFLFPLFPSCFVLYLLSVPLSPSTEVIKWQWHLLDRFSCSYIHITSSPVLSFQSSSRCYCIHPVNPSEPTNRSLSTATSKNRFAHVCNCNAKYKERCAITSSFLTLLEIDYNFQTTQQKVLVFQLTTTIGLQRKAYLSDFM
jgi:hypothetical protein